MNTDNGKVTAGHLRRDAYLYVRQSTMYQVIHNTESTRRQYDLKGRAAALGWQPEQIHVIDIDQGSSGASAADRAGFQQLVGEVSLGRAGIVLHYLQARMRGGLLAKAARGELPLRLPVGFTYDLAGNVVLDPDTGVRKAVSHLFTVFEQTGSASAVVKAFTAADLKFPARDSIGERAGELYWKPLRHDQVLFVLHNPCYAGAYFYGRRAHHRTGGKTTTITKPREQWTTLIPGAHDGYITWEQFEASQRQLAANATARGEDRKAGPPREGPALLQGLVVCGKCGKRMTVGYHTRCDGTLVPDYACQRDGINTGTAPCQNVCGSGVDAAVAALAADLPALWNNPATSVKDRKRLIRLLVTDVTLARTAEHITAHVRLPGGQARTLTVPRPLTAYEQHTTPGHVDRRRVPGRGRRARRRAALGGRALASGAGRGSPAGTGRGHRHDGGGRVPGPVQLAVAVHAQRGE